MTVRYRWEIIWDAALSNYLLVERYGYSGTKSYAWTYNGMDTLIQAMHGRLNRFEFQADQDVLECYEMETSTFEEYKASLERWTHDNDREGDFFQRWNRAIYVFENQRRVTNPVDSPPDLDGPTREMVSLFMTTVTHGAWKPSFGRSIEHSETPVGLDLNRPVPQAEPARAANWGAW
jgi:hypothetical protein